MSIIKTPSPQTEAQLLERAQAIAGLSIGQLAAQFGALVPYNQQREKGWVGQLLELALGASAASRPEADFPHLGIELKTLPLNQNGQPKESTFVCTISLLTIQQAMWKDSLVYRKLSHVLWLPIEADRAIPLNERRIGSAILWTPSATQEKRLQQDWQELTDLIVMGRLNEIHGRLGHYLQIRPKAANAKSLRWAIGEGGERLQTLPRGFYLRTCLTTQILAAG